MSRGAQAASRLGTPIVECVECDVTAFRDESLAILRTEKSVPWPADVSGAQHVCSVHCAILFASGRIGFLRAFRWNRRDENWVELGTRALADPRWNWTDTGEARWLEENAARLREAGEIL